MKSTFTYSVLRYRPDYLLQEEVNIGLLIRFNAENVFKFLYPDSLARLKSLYPNYSNAHLRSYLHAFEKVVQRLNRNEALSKFDTLSRSFLDAYFIPLDSTALYFTEPKSGIYNDPKEITKYYKELFFSVYGSKSSNDKKDEHYITQKFKTEWDKLASTNTEKTLIQDFVIKAPLIEATFEYAWKNGATNLITPIGFDLLKAGSIEDKAYQWQGKLSLLKNELKNQNAHIDIIASVPSKKELFTSYDKAIRIIESSEADIDIYQDKDISSYAEHALEHSVRAE